MGGRFIAVIGSSGVVGRALLEYLQGAGEKVVGLSRRPPADLPDAPFTPLDLLDEKACQEIVTSTLKHTTHIVYTALYEKPGLIAGWQEQDQMQTNLTMIRNGDWKLYLSPARMLSKRDLDKNWKDPKAPDGTTIIAQAEQASNKEYPGLLPPSKLKNPLPLYNVRKDPSESKDLSDQFPEVVSDLRKMVEKLEKSLR